LSGGLGENVDVAVLCTFDVFDTVLSRRLGAPRAVIELLADELSAAGRLPGSAANFVQARLKYDVDLTRTLDRPPTLAEIYARVAAALVADETAPAAWCSAEEDLERRLCVATPGADQLLKAARESGRSVVFISDTPHREAFIRELLETTGLCQPEDRVFCSAERGASKSTGRLFQIVREHLPEATFFHVGDNSRADLAAPRVEGWSSGLRPVGQLSRYEELIEGQAGALGLTASWLAGSVRLARLEAIDRGVPPALAAVAAGVVGPMLIGYALWVAAEAKARGITHLYYVARDGEIMQQVAEPVLAAISPDVRSHYLYGSRQPWSLAASAHSLEALRGWLDVKSDFSVRNVLARVGLEPAAAFAACAHELLAPDRVDQPLSPDQRSRLAELITTSPLLDLVEEQARAAATLTTSYLVQEGVFGGPPTALVDAGWEGRSARAVDLLADAAGATRPQHLFIGLNAKSAAIRGDGHAFTAWLADETIDHDALHGFPGLNVVIEMFCVGTEGRTVGYRTDPPGPVTPVLTEARNSQALEWGAADLQAIARRVAELVSPHLSGAALHADTRRLAWNLLRAFWLTPSNAEAAFWGAFPWEEDNVEGFAPVAQALSVRDAAQRWRRGDRQIRRVNSWRAGSAAVSGQPWRSILTARGWQERNSARLQRIPRRVRLELAARRRNNF
jgi:FMN phosphatase YigB (HAD superfamily)